MSTGSISLGESCCIGIARMCGPHPWLQPRTEEKIKSIAIGAFTGLACVMAMAVILYACEKYISNFEISQDAIQMFKAFDGYHPLIQMFWQSVWRGYVVLLGPILEEWMFRGFVFKAIMKKQGVVDEGSSSTHQKIARVLLVSLIFGACHLSPFQSTMSNVVIFGLTGGLGIALAVLREKRKDLLAPTVAHIMINLSATL